MLNILLPKSQFRFGLGLCFGRLWNRCCYGGSCGDERDYAFANFKAQSGMQEIKKYFANVDISKEAYGSKDNVIIANSDFLDG
jgi:hypothetical protein